MPDDVASLLRATPLPDVSEPLIQRLVAEGVAESQSLEYKEAFPTSWSEKEKAELRKDVVAMANGRGGTIIWGIEEDKQSRATAFHTITDAAAKQTQLHAILIDAIDPPLRPSLRIMKIEKFDLILLRIEPPDNPPHCIETSEWNRRFPVRQGTLTRAMTMQEIRQAMHGDQLSRDVARMRELLERSEHVTVNVPLDQMSDQDLLLKIDNADQFAEEVLKRLDKQANSRAVFLLVCVPEPLTTNLPLREHEDRIAEILVIPPGSRPNGWFLAPNEGPPPRRVPLGPAREDTFHDMRLTVAWNGAAVYEESLETSLATWGYEAVNGIPVLNPLAIIEPLVRMFALMKTLWTFMPSMERVQVRAQLMRASKFLITPFRSDSYAIKFRHYDSFPDIVKPIKNETLSVLPHHIPVADLDDKQALEVAKDLFVEADFDKAKLRLPYFDESGKFTL